MDPRLSSYRATGSTPAYRNGHDNQIVTAVRAVRDVLSWAGWTKTADYHAQIYIDTPLGFPSSGGFPGCAGQHLCSEYDWNTGVLLVSYDIKHVVAGTIVGNVECGGSSAATKTNLATAITAGGNWNATYDPVHDRINMVSKAIGDAALGGGFTAFQGAPLFTVAPVPQWGAGFAMQSKAMPQNTAIRLDVLEGPAQYGNIALQLRFPWFAQFPPQFGWESLDGYFMAQSASYTLWASPYGFAMWEVFDIQNRPYYNAPDFYSGNRNFLVSQIYQDGAWANPLQVFIGGPSRFGIASTHADRAESMMSLINSDTFSRYQSMTEVNPLWSFFVPRFSADPQALKSSNGSPVMVESLFGMVRGSASPPCRMYGWLPDSFILMDDRPLEDQILYKGNTYVCFRSKQYGAPGTAGNRPAASLYLATRPTAVRNPGADNSDFPFDTGWVSIPTVPFDHGTLANYFINWYPDSNLPLSQLHVDGHIDGTQTFFTLSVYPFIAPNGSTDIPEPPFIVAAMHGGIVVEYMRIIWLSGVGDPGVVNALFCYVQRGITYNGSTGSSPNARWNLSDLTFVLPAAPVGQFTSALITQPFGGSAISVVFDNAGLYFEPYTFYRESFNVTYSPSGSGDTGAPFIVVLEDISAPGTAVEYMEVINIVHISGDNYKWTVNHWWVQTHSNLGAGTAPKAAHPANQMVCKCLLPDNIYP